MKFYIYFDVYPWTRKPEDIYPTIIPGPKQKGAKRYRVDVGIEDPNEPDEITQSIGMLVADKGDE